MFRKILFPLILLGVLSIPIFMILAAIVAPVFFYRTERTAQVNHRTQIRGMQAQAQAAAGDWINQSEAIIEGQAQQAQAQANDMSLSVPGRPKGYEAQGSVPFPPGYNRTVTYHSSGPPAMAMRMVLFIPVIILLCFLLLILGIFFLGGRMRSKRRGIADEEAQMLGELMSGLDKMTDRVESLEAILLQRTKRGV